MKFKNINKKNPETNITKYLIKNSKNINKDFIDIINEQFLGFNFQPNKSKYENNILN